MGQHDFGPFLTTPAIYLQAQEGVNVPHCKLLIGTIQALLLIRKMKKNALCLGTEYVMLLQTILSKSGCFFLKDPPMKKKENQNASRKVDAGTCCGNRKPVNGNIVYASQRQDLLLQPFDLVILNILIRVFS